MAKKRLLYIEDLYDFYTNKYKRSTKFSAEKSGEPLVVQVHGRVNFDESDKNKDGLLAVHLQSCHTDLNVNGSNIKSTVMENALPSFSNRPILGYIHKVVTDENPDGQWEFYSHNMHEDENGEVVYDEYPIGIIPESCNAQLVYDEEKDKTYCEVDGYIFEEYSKAAEILQREGECSVSVELSIRELSYDAKQKILNIEDFWFSGVTILGKTPQGEVVQPGMSGSNIKLTDFSSKNNSLFENYEARMSELQERLEKLEACFNKKQNIPVKTISKEGGIDNKMTKFEELLTKYNKTVEDITFDYEKMSDEELEVKFTEMFDDDAGKGEFDNPSSNGESSVSTNSIGKNFSKDELFNKLFELSFDDIRYALNALCSIYRNDSEWCYVSQVYEDYFIMQDWDSDKFYKQTYEKDGDNVSLSGERIEMFSMLLTESEKTVVDEMRSNYTALKEFKENAEKNELHSKREKILESEKFASISEKDTEGNFVNKDFENLYTNMDNYSFEDLEKEAKVILADYALSVQTFSAKPTAPKSSVLYMSNSNSEKESKEKDPYGGIFKKYKQK